jgi:hypothetical protein
MFLGLHGCGVVQCMGNVHQRNKAIHSFYEQE